ncbi:MAG TPA: hypothetical protein DCY95_02545 [Algoriphagus sp.]|jgi:hypothetical protein|nr:hypothetical protein [Algoriphagus sp.]|tara:strand:+ start:1185 stop:1367 length:183 start_codon:yes stop_codon:yes gene_type:complete
MKNKKITITIMLVALFIIGGVMINENSRIDPPSKPPKDDPIGLPESHEIYQTIYINDNTL